MTLFRGDRAGLLFIAPALFVFLVVLSFPIGYAGYLSVFKVKPDFSLVFNGTANFVNSLMTRTSGTRSGTRPSTLLAASRFIWSIGFTLALALNSPWLKGRLLFRIAFFVPWSISFVVTAVTWRWVLNAQYGILNAFLRRIGVLSENVSWLGSAELALPTAILVNAWRGFPFVMVMIYAGLQAIPKEPYEAAMVDGASKLQLFRLHHPSRAARGHHGRHGAGYDLGVHSIRTDPSPDGRWSGAGYRLLTNLIYRESFTFYEFGIGSAMAMLTLLVVLCFSLVYVRLLGREVIRG